jgi:hypothetical protein
VRPISIICRLAAVGALALALLAPQGRALPTGVRLAGAAHPQQQDASAPRSAPGTTVVQFPLAPSGVKAAFPRAAGLVTIVRGDRDFGLTDTVTVDVWNLPPNVRFTIFYTQFAGKPFGNVEYVQDLTTRADGRGEAVVQDIAFVAFAMDARNPGTSVDEREGLTSGTNLEHLGLWFGSLDDAKRVLKDGTLSGTIFDGGGPPLHAGPQALTDGQTGPAF